MNKIGCSDHVFADFIASLLHYNPGNADEIKLLGEKLL